MSVSILASALHLGFGFKQYLADGTVSCHDTLHVAFSFPASAKQLGMLTFNDCVAGEAMLQALRMVE